MHTRFKGQFEVEEFHDNSQLASMISSPHSRFPTLFLTAFALFFVLFPVRADVGLFLQEAIGVSGEETSAGHAAIYLTNICSDGPLRLRMCGPGEAGVVLCAYPEWGLNKQYRWLAVPLRTYLYGVTDGQEIPIYSNGEIRTMFWRQASETYFRDLYAATPNGSIKGSLPPGRWREVIGTLLNRDIYEFRLKTTPEEDAAFLAKFEETPDESKFGVMYNNCADFARNTINLYFPRATHRDVLNDFTMTTPKALARSLTRYAEKRPERLLYVTKYAQVPGPIRRSLDNRNFSEHALFSKKYLIPQILLKQELLVIFGASYFLTGYFNPDKQYQKFADPEIARLTLEESKLRQKLTERGSNLNNFRSYLVPPADSGEPNASLKDLSSRKTAERARLLGTAARWDTYKSEFKPIIARAIANGLFADAREVKTFFRDLELQSQPYFANDGKLMLKVEAYGKDYTLGVTRTNIASPESDPELAYKLILARINFVLTARSKNRETMIDFEADWALLNELSSRYASLQPEGAQAKLVRPRFLVHPEKTTFGQKAKKAFVFITH